MKWPQHSRIIVNKLPLNPDSHMTSPLRIPLFCMVLSLACTVQLAKAQTWSGGDVPSGNLNWSDGNNWVGGVAPGSSGAVAFNDGAYPISTNAQGATNNIVSTSTSISSLSYNAISGSGHYDTTVIPSGNTLTVSGNISVGTSDASGQNTVTTITGGGSLFAGTNGSATLSGQDGSGSGTSILDLSGLANFSFNAAGGSSGAVSLGTGGSGSSITIDLARSSNSITCGTLNLGNNNTSGTEVMNAGNGTNNIFADTINIGLGKVKGTLQFINNAGGGLKIANHTGTGRADITLSGPGGSGTTSANIAGNMLLNGGAVNILAGTMIVGDRGNRGTSGGNGSASGILSFNNGVVDATSIIMATNSGSGAPVTGAISVGSATLRIGTGGLIMVNQGATLAATGTLIVTNGSTVTCSGNIFKGTSTGLATISISGSTLTMSSESGTIGVNNQAAINFFNVTNSTLTLPAIGIGQPSVLVSNLNPDTVTTTTINIGALPIINSFPAQFPVISYTVAGGNLANETSGLTNIVLGTLPSPFTGYFSNNLANPSAPSIDLVITNGPLPKADIWKGATNDVWDITTFNWTSGGIATNYDDLDQVTFDDTSVTNVVNLTGTRTPSASSGLTFNNNITNYTLTGIGKISGPVQLLKYGSATTTLFESGGDNFSGGINISGGTLILDDANSAISGGLTIGGGTTVQIGNNDSNGTLPTGTLDDEGTLVYDHANNITASVVVPGGGALAQNDTNTLTLSAANTYTGPTMVNAGTLALTGSGSIADSSSVTVSNATLDVSGVTSIATLTALNLSNANLNVKVGYIQTNLNINGALGMGGTTNVINVKTLPAIAYYPATLVLLNAGSGISGFNTLGLGTLPASTPAYVGSISQIGNTVVLTLSSGPTNSRPSVTWSGADAISTGITNWSDALNWQTPGVPMATEPVIFNDTDATGGSPFGTIGDGIGGIQNGVEVNNYVDISLTNSALTYGNSGDYQNTRIGSGKALTINGSLTVNGSGGISTILGAGGTLQMTDPNNNNTLNIENASVPTLDMSGLDTFNANVNQMEVGYASSAAYGIWYLAKTNIITTGSGFLGAGAAWVIGGSGSQNSAGNAQVYLGQTNAIYVDGICLGPGPAIGDTLTFNPNLTNPAVYIRGITGSSSRVTLWSLGDDTVNLNNGPDGGSHIVDFTAGTISALVSTLIIGQGDQGNTAVTPNLVDTFNIGTGNLNVLTLEIGVSDNGKTGGGGIGVMNVTGGTVEAGSLSLAAGTVAATSGALNLSNATLVVSNGITIGTGNVGGTLSISNSIVELLGGTIGTSAAPLSTLNLAGATLQMNLNGFAATDIVSTNVITNGLTTIEIGSITNAFNGQTYPLISYAGSANDPFSSFSLAPLPVGYAGLLVDNTTTGVIGLQLTSGPALARPLITAFGINGTTLTISATNGQDGGPYTVYGTTNLSPPVIWTPIFTNNFNATGAINNLSTNVVKTAVPDEFFLLEEP